MRADCCFPKSNRLTKPSEFQTVYQQNNIRIKGRYFLVLVFSRLDSSFSLARVGVVASKKVSKRAVIRNKIKRYMRESFRLRQAPSGFDYVIIAKVGADKADASTLQNELSYLWGKIAKRCKTS